MPAVHHLPFAPSRPLFGSLSPRLNAGGTLMSLDLEGIVKGLADGLFTSEQLVKIYMERARQVDDALRIIAQFNPDAIQIARERDEQRKSRKSIGPLHGVPILVKETLATTDKMSTTAGSLALGNAIPRRESTVISRLRAAGAVILGKTNLSEWSNTRGTVTPNGWTPKYGQCLGGFTENQDPEGSSSGSAVAASLGLAAATIGAETCGSIVLPCQRNAVVGLKPTMGLTSRAGVIPVSSQQDSIGPITRHVKDAAMLLNVISGYDEFDDATKALPWEKTPDFTESCDTKALQGIKVAVPREAITSVLDPEVLATFNEALETIVMLGGKIIDNLQFSKWRPLKGMRNELSNDIALREGLEGYFRDLVTNPQNISTFGELFRFMRHTPEERAEDYGLDWFQNTLERSQDSMSPEFRESSRINEDLGADIQRLLDSSDCQAMVVPTSTDIPHDLGGNPAITVPLGFYAETRGIVRSDKGLIQKAPNIPYALMFVGRRFSDKDLIGYAFAFEQATQVQNQSKPVVHPTIDISLVDGSKIETEL